MQAEGEGDDAWLQPEEHVVPRRARGRPPGTRYSRSTGNRDCPRSAAKVPSTTVDHAKERRSGCRNRRNVGCMTRGMRVEKTYE